jgi:hypothetical protein
VTGIILAAKRQTNNIAIAIVIGTLSILSTKLYFLKRIPMTKNGKKANAR